MDSKKQQNNDLTNLNFHYKREERLKEKEKFHKKPKGKTKNWLFLLLKVIGLVILVNLMIYFLVDEEKGIPFSSKTKEMVFKDDILVEVNLKSKIEEKQHLSIYLQKGDFLTPPQEEILEPFEDKILYFSLPYEEEKNYILNIHGKDREYYWEKSF